MTKIYEIISRNQDVVFGNNDLELLHEFKKFPAFAGCVDHPFTDDILEDLKIYISQKSGMIQLNPVLPTHVVYQQNNGTGSIGQSWLNHHKEFAKFISSYQPKKVFEIAGGHGNLSKSYRDINQNIKWTIIEPNPSIVSSVNIEVIEGFFTNASQISQDVDMIVHSHFFEHVLNPMEFVTNLKTVKTNTKLCFSVPALRKHLEKKFSSILNFEHTYLCTEEFIEWSLQNNGFRLLDKQVYDNDHSIFYSFEKTEQSINVSYTQDCYVTYKKLFQEYLEYNLNFVEMVNQTIKNTNSEVFLFGGHFISLFTIHFGLDLLKISCILDNSKIKEGKRLYGTNLMVHNPTILKDLNSPVVILRAGVFNNEIKTNILENINPTVKFLEQV